MEEKDFSFVDGAFADFFDSKNPRTTGLRDAFGASAAKKEYGDFSKVSIDPGAPALK